MIPTYIICSKLNILNSMSALIIPFMVSGFGIFLCRQFAESIPNDILEAARIDGAGEWRIFFGIVIHTIKPAIAALCIFIFMGRWNDYLWPLIAIVDEDKMTLPLALNFFNSSLFNGLLYFDECGCFGYDTDYYYIFYFPKAVYRRNYNDWN